MARMVKSSGRGGSSIRTRSACRAAKNQASTMGPESPSTISSSKDVSVRAAKRVRTAWVAPPNRREAIQAAAAVAGRASHCHNASW